ncbi:MAG: hypothetical protein QNK05_18890 [Myxococcota bacterium]|nr:hypothetical protein [Myxococcota bacterium]
MNDQHDQHDQTLTEWIQQAVERGATSVEEIHKEIADLPFEVLERNGLFERTAAEVRDVQDRSIGAVYDVIRGVNRRVGELASDLLESRSRT